MTRVAAAVVLAAISTAAAAEKTIPKNATMLEQQPVAENRMLILWMPQPQRHPRQEPNEPYTCPEYTRGHYYSGRARVSLLDTATGKVINTINILADEEEGTVDSVDLPYRIARGYYYHVEGAAEGKEGTPTILHLKDYNGDGDPAEFALFNAEACMGLATTLFGYSKRQDKVVQYRVHLQIHENGKSRASTQKWVDYVFSKEPLSPGRWKFEIDYRGRGGTLDTYEVTYNAEKEHFEGTLTSTEGDEE